MWFGFFDPGSAREDAADAAPSFAVNRRYALDAYRAVREPFEVRIGESVLGHGHAAGVLQGDGHSARWDLSWDQAPATHLHLPGVFYRTRLAESRVLSPNLDVAVRGRIEVDGRVFVLEGDPGGQTHLWGRRHAHAWAWGHCTAFEGRPGAVLEALTARLERGGLVLPRLTLLTLRLDGEELRFTGLGDLLRCRGRFGTACYAFQASRGDDRLSGAFVCRADDMVQAEYADPDGTALYCANTVVGDLHVTVWRRARRDWEERARLTARGTGHFEVAGRKPDPLIVRRHVEVRE